MIGLLKCQVSQKEKLVDSYMFPLVLYILSVTYIDHNYSLLKLNHASFHKWMYFFLAFSFIKIRKYRIVIEFIRVLDALSWLKMSLTFRSDFIDNMHTFYNVAKIYLNLRLIFMHFQFHEIFPKLWKWQENRNLMRFYILFSHIKYITFFFYIPLLKIFFKFQELPVSTCTDIYFFIHLQFH